MRYFLAYRGSGDSYISALYENIPPNKAGRYWIVKISSTKTVISVTREDGSAETFSLNGEIHECKCFLWGRKGSPLIFKVGEQAPPFEKPIFRNREAGFRPSLPDEA